MTFPWELPLYLDEVPQYWCVWAGVPSIIQNIPQGHTHILSLSLSESVCIFNFPDTEDCLRFHQTISCCHFSLEYSRKEEESQTRPSSVTPLILYLEVPSSIK